MVFTRFDWTEFRDLSRISNRAGVSVALLPRVVVKELADNALDAGGEVEFGDVETAAANEVGFYVADAGAGIPGTDQEIATRFSVSRPLTSSKTLRRPTRGMLGNGTRVVAGAVLCCGGTLKISTRGRTLTLRPEVDDGTTKVIETVPWDGAGTRVEVVFRDELARLAKQDNGLFDWAKEAVALAGLGTVYTGQTSPHWYDASAFWEVLQAAGATPVERLVAQLDGCTARARITQVVGELRGRRCSAVTPQEARNLLDRCRTQVKAVTAARLGRVGPRKDYGGYAITQGELETPSGPTVPVVVEVWANRASVPDLRLCVNRTPVVTQVNLERREGDYAVFGAGLRHAFPAGRKGGGEFRLLINVTAPLLPLTSTGKDPDLKPLVAEVLETCEKAVRRLKRAGPAKVGGGSQKDLILTNVDETARTLSGGGARLFSLRQMFYAMRPALIKALGKEPDYKTFSRVIAKHEDRHGDIENLYRDDRGILYHPHTGQRIPLGTRTVAGYERPLFTFNKILYCEKEGLFPMLQQARWPEQFDCALVTSKGFATKAARELLRLLVASGEAVQIFVIHDADGPGTVIYESLASLAKKHNIKVTNLGLDPAEARAMGLQEERVVRKKGGRVPVASYVPKTDQEWLQTNRIELNAMHTQQFLDWLSEKIRRYDTGKVVPPAPAIRDRLRAEVRTAIQTRLVEEAITHARVAEQVSARVSELDESIREHADALAGELGERLADSDRHWSALATGVALELARSAGE